MKTQPQRLLESIIPQPLPEWVHEEWTREIANKWAIREAGEKVADALREMIGAVTPQARLKSIAALDHWQKLLNEPKQPVVQ